MDSRLLSKLRHGLDTLAIPYSAPMLEQLMAYLTLLEKWNTRFNLSGVIDPDAMVSRHLLDSLAINPYLKGQRFLDVGSGAGLPGIPLAILNPDCHFTLLDSNGKKTRFLFQVKTALKLENVSIENCRVEHYQSPKQIDMVMCRAFASLADVLDKAQSLVSSGASLLAMKGKYPELEIGELPPDAIVQDAIKLAIPGLSTERHVIIITTE